MQPNVYPYSEPFFEGAKEGKLILPFCVPCEAFFYYPRVMCPECGNARIENKEAEKTGTIETFSILHRAPAERFEKEIPYAMGVVRMMCGVRILLRIKGDFQKISVGKSGVIKFEEQEGLALPFFEMD